MECIHESNWMLTGLVFQGFRWNQTDAIALTWYFVGDISPSEKRVYGT
jgi:hypothetical protein